MKVLFDQGTPAPLRRHLEGYSVDTVNEKGWSILENGDLLGAAELSGYEVLLTTDQDLRYQQNLTLRTISIVVLLTTDWRIIQTRTEDVQGALKEIIPGALIEIPF